MKIVHKNFDVTGKSIRKNSDVTLQTTGEVLKAIYKTVETCIVKQLYPDNYQFHA